jgi:hypothetical protein
MSFLDQDRADPTLATERIGKQLTLSIAGRRPGFGGGNMIRPSPDTE